MSGLPPQADDEESNNDAGSGVDDVHAANRCAARIAEL